MLQMTQPTHDPNVLLGATSQYMAAYVNEIHVIKKAKFNLGQYMKPKV